MINKSVSVRTPHQWKFARIGGLDQVVLETADDLLNLDQLDQKLWVALSCPVKGLETDEKTLSLIDTDGDGRIRVPELLAAIKWLAAHAKDVSAILRVSNATSEPALALDNINDTTPEGAALLASARRILTNLGQPNDSDLSMAAACDTKKVFSASPFNGDGVIPFDIATAPELQKIIAEIIATQGSAIDLSEKSGINQANTDKFYADIAARGAWLATAKEKPEIMPLGSATPEAYAALKTARAKIDDYFARNRLAAFDPRALASVNRTEKDYLALASGDLRAASDELAAFPIAQIVIGKSLSLTDGINPAWSAAVAAFLRATVVPVLGVTKTDLTEADWATLAGKFAPYEKWLATKPGLSIEALTGARINEIAIDAARTQAELNALIARDKELETELKAIADVERVARYHAHLGTVLRNFVNFADFYAPNRAAIFQAGVLYLDSRSCELCVRVADPAAHSLLASLSRACIAYCDLKRPGGETMKIAACFTQGNSDFLMVGRNGLFYDRKGRDWDATITKLVDNPISLREAFWSPYKKFVRMIEEVLAKRAASADSAATDKLSAMATKVATIDKNTAITPGVPATPAAPALVPKKIDVGTVAALGVAVGAITGALAAISTGLTRLAFWQILFVPVAIILIISMPSVFVAWLKLRQRTLGPILDATGWAINGRIKINIPLGTSLTGRAELPVGARRTLKDPYEDKDAKRHKIRLIFWIFFLALAASAAWAFWDYNHAQSWFWERL